MVKSLPFILMILIGCCAFTTAGATVDVRIERQTVSVNDSFRIVFVADRQVAAPDFSPLEKDFEVLSTAQSNNVSMVNGRFEQTVSWTVDLIPRRAGQLTVPPIEFGGERTAAQTVTVTPTGRADGTVGGDVFLELEAEPANPYVQAQIRFTVRVLLAVRTAEASLTEPRVTSGDAVIERLGEDVGYETNRGGTRFSVVERTYAIFPQQSGKVVIDPIVFEARVGGQRSFFGRSGGRRLRARSEQMEIDVRPIPDRFTGQVWLPAEQMILTEDWPGNESEWRVGEPMTRSLTLRARGLTPSQLPEIGSAVPDGFRQYPDQPQLVPRTADGSLVGERRETIALIPSEAGSFTLPTIEIPWWNTTTDTLEVARLPARTVRVLPAAGALPDRTTAQPSPDTGAAQVDDNDRAESSSATGPAAAAGVWQWLTAAFALLWLGTLAGWWWSRSRNTLDTRPVKIQSPKPAAAVAALERACASGDAAAAQEAVLRWATTRWPGNPARSLGELAARLDGPMQTELHRLSRARFGAQTEAWDGAALWQAFESWKSRRREEPRPAKPELEPLYRA